MGFFSNFISRAQSSLIEVSDPTKEIKQQPEVPTEVPDEVSPAAPKIADGVSRPLLQSKFEQRKQQIGDETANAWDNVPEDWNPPAGVQSDNIRNSLGEKGNFRGSTDSWLFNDGNKRQIGYSVGKAARESNHDWMYRMDEPTNLKRLGEFLSEVNPKGHPVLQYLQYKMNNIEKWQQEDDDYQKGLKSGKINNPRKFIRDIFHGANEDLRGAGNEDTRKKLRKLIQGKLKEKFGEDGFEVSKLDDFLYDMDLDPKEFPMEDFYIPERRTKLGAGAEIIKRLLQIERDGASGELSPVFKNLRKQNEGALNALGWASDEGFEYPWEETILGRSNNPTKDDKVDSPDLVPALAEALSDAMKGNKNWEQGIMAEKLERLNSVYKRFFSDEDSVVNQALDGKNLSALDDVIGDILDDIDNPNDDRQYDGGNTSWSLESQFGDALMDNFELNDEMDTNIGESYPKEVSWGNDVLGALGFGKFNGGVTPAKIKEKIMNSTGGDTQKILDAIMESKDKRKTVKLLDAVNEFLEANQGEYTFDEALGEKSDEFANHFLRKTPLDALRTWKEQVLPDLEDGDVLKNSPMGGGRGGNARERLYAKAGFGDLMDDDYQYGYMDSEKNPNKLTPITKEDVSYKDPIGRAIEDIDYEELAYNEPSATRLGITSDEIRDAMEQEREYGTFEGMDEDDVRSFAYDAYNNMIETRLDDYDWSSDISDSEAFSKILDEIDSEDFDADELDDFINEEIAEMNMDEKLNLLKMIENDDDNLYNTLKGYLETYLADK